MIIIKTIDLSQVPLKKNGDYDWEKAIGLILNFTYDDIQGEIQITGFNKRKNQVKIKYKERERSYNASKIVYVNFYNIFDIKNDFKFNPGDEVKNFLIKEQTYKDHIRAYKVECLKCHKEQTMEQFKLIKSKQPICINCKKESVKDDRNN